MEQGRNRSQGGSIQPSMMNKTQQENENPNQAKKYRDRINQYAAKKKKFGDTGKFLFR